MNAPYAEALAKTRSPLKAERLGTPLAMTIRGDRAQITTYHEASWRRILSVGAREIVASPLEDPDGTPEHIPLAGSRSRIYVALWPHTRVTYRRIDTDPETYARRVVLAGTYKDAKGERYRFTETGEWTAGTAAPRNYHVSLDTSEACCDYFVVTQEGRVPSAEGPASSAPLGPRPSSLGPLATDERHGFRWKDGKLQLFRVILDPKGCPISCAKTPYAVLTPVR